MEILIGTLFLTFVVSISGLLTALFYVDQNVGVIKRTLLTLAIMVIFTFVVFPLIGYATYYGGVYAMWLVQIL